MVGDMHEFKETEYSCPSGTSGITIWTVLEIRVLCRAEIESVFLLVAEKQAAKQPLKPHTCFLSLLPCLPVGVEVCVH